jgi:hypothetical protein
MRILPLCSLNRRTMLGRAGALAATFGLGHGVSPMQAHDGNLAEHPLAGTWLARANPPLPDDPEGAGPSLIGVVGVLTRSGPVAHAQGASPASGQMAAAGTTGEATFETVAFARGLTLPNPADVIMIRIGLDPGASVPINHTEPMAGLLLVESGTLTFHSSEPQTVTRASLAAAIATAEATGDDDPASETIPAGTEMTLNAGEATFVTATATGTLRNDGQAPASGLITLFVASAGPVAATPAA